MTRMFSDGVTFEDALAEAKRLGYAEKDPTDDVEGIDACRKICILAALSFGKHVYPEEVYTEGITKITSADTAYADFAGCVIKLIGRAKRTQNGKCIAAVYPAFVSNKNPLSHVDDVFNGITVRGDAIGDVMFYSDRTEVRAEAEKLFGEIKVLGRNGEDKGELAFITPYAFEYELTEKLSRLGGCKIVSTMRLLD